MKNYKKLAFLFLLSAIPSFAQINKPLAGLNIMLDPGHGGRDSGAVGPMGLKESDTNLRVAQYLRMLLEHDGAKVTMTRNKKDSSLSLSNRVAKSNEAMPDLFISIHHNASLHPRSTNQSEIYYDAKDHGLSRHIGESLNKELGEKQFAGNSKIIPAGFYVLRNNNAPSVLTEGSYISIPESERNLRSGKGLTKEAEILWKSIRKAYANGALKIDLYNGKDNNLNLNTPYFNCIFTSNKPIKEVNARISEANSNVGIRSLMPYPITYTLYNEEPLKSGNYELIFSAVSYDGMPSARKKVKLNVELPIANASLESVAPIIPLGFKGKFPVNVKIFDSLGNLNTRVMPITVKYNQERTCELTTTANGFATGYLELDGNETGTISLEAYAEGNKIAESKIPVGTPAERFVLGKLTGYNNMPLSKAVIKHNGETIAQTGFDGSFYFAYPKTTNEYEIEVVPAYGHKAFTETIKTEGEPVILPILTAEAIAPSLLNKKIGIMAPNSMNETARSIIKPLIQAGAKPIRLRMPNDMSHPEYQAVLEANLIKDLGLIVSLKAENSKNIQIRHYHSSKNGKKLADAVKANFAKRYPKANIVSCPGSDYELGHTGSTALVISIPSKPTDSTREEIANEITQALKSDK